MSTNLYRPVSLNYFCENKHYLNGKEENKTGDKQREVYCVDH